MSGNKDIEAFARSSAHARVGALSAQASHDDASVMIGSAERALADLHKGLSDPAAHLPPRRAAPLAAAPVVHHSRSGVRWLSAVAFLACMIGLGAIVTWPAGNGSANNGTTTAIIDAASQSAPIDGIETLPRPSSSDAVSRIYAAEFGRTDATNVRCLAEAVYYEARGEPYIGQVAVAQVVLNRARSGKWPHGLCAVISQGIDRGEKCQFSYMCRTARAQPVGAMWERAQEVAIDAVRGRVWLRELVEATHYHTTSVTPVWRHGLDELVTFGAHIFYRSPELGFVLSVATASQKPVEKPADSVAAEKPTGERSHESTSALADAPLDFKLPEPAPAPVVVAKPRPVVRHTRTVSETAVAPKSDPSWMRELQNR